MKGFLMCFALVSVSLSAAAAPPPTEHRRDATVHDAGDVPIALQVLECAPDIELAPIAELPAVTPLELASAGFCDQVLEPAHVLELPDAYDTGPPLVYLDDSDPGDRDTISYVLRRASRDRHRVDDVASAKPILRLRC